MIKIKCYANLLLTVLLPATLIALPISDSLSINGHYLGLFNAFKEGNRQFDFATNIDLNYKISDSIKGMVQLQGGSGHGSLGFAGPAATITDINIEYTLKKQKSIITLGSFDTPFGQDTTVLTNNADTTKQTFIINSLLYSALAGPVGTLNTLGIKAEKKVKEIEAILSLSNGTGESSANKKTFQFLIQLGNKTWFKNTHITGTFMNSDDREDLSLENTNSFKTNFTGLILDAKYTPSKQSQISSYIAHLTYNDHKISTNDGVWVSKIEASYTKKNLSSSIQVSHWNPEKSQNSSSQMATPGLNKTNNNTSNITRAQIAFTLKQTKNISYSIEGCFDRYSQINNEYGILSAVNLTF